MLPKPTKNDTLQAYWRRVASSNVPPGGRPSHDRIRDARVEGVKRDQKSSQTVVFNIEGKCSGRLEDVLELGIREVKKAMELGTDESRAWAKKAIARMQKLPLEYEIHKLIQRMIAAS